jgi:hypothetical protein
MIETPAVTLTGILIGIIMIVTAELKIKTNES